MSPANKTPANPHEKQPAEGGIYAGLTSHTADTYETIKMDKKPIVWWRFGVERMLSPETPELNLLKLYTV